MSNQKKLIFISIFCALSFLVYIMNNTFRFYFILTIFSIIFLKLLQIYKYHKYEFIQNTCIRYGDKLNNYDKELLEKSKDLTNYKVFHSKPIIFQPREGKLIIYIFFNHFSNLINLIKDLIF